MYKCKQKVASLGAFLALFGVSNSTAKMPGEVS